MAPVARAMTPSSIPATNCVLMACCIVFSDVNRDVMSPRLRLWKYWVGRRSSLANTPELHPILIWLLSQTIAQDRSQPSSS
ncbi:hypothetical protein G6F61_014169 [Rhizopus arrhizus]|nr:hypothetical protein G6F61_014169 [Rhizopus arrhizus]